VKIFVTGHKGYLGSGFLERYERLYDVIGYDLKDGDDLLDYENLQNKMVGCEQIIHLAAIPGPKEGKSFEEYFVTNVRATLNVAKAALSNGVKRVIYASSTTIYGIEKGIPFTNSYHRRTGVRLSVSFSEPIILPGCRSFVSYEQSHGRADYGMVRPQ